VTRKAQTTMSLEEIGEREGLSASAIRLVINRALRKLRGQPAVITARELAVELDRNRREIVE
jgi:DNA-directed RNA polymerase sigma subunit (sigma70/sigma32)